MHTYDENNKKNGSKFLGYCVTAMIAFIIGFVLAFTINLAVFSTETFPLKNTSSPAPSSEASETSAPNRKPSGFNNDNNDNGTPSLSTFTPTEIETDGILPLISDTANPIPEIVEQLASGIVSIINYGYYDEYNSNMEQGSGTGFIISTSGYIVTNAHLVEDASAISVLVADEEIEAEIIGVDKTTDVALIKIDSKYTGTALALGDSSAVRTGEFVVAIGDPTGRELAGTPTFGIVSAVNREVNIDGRTNSYIQTDAAINPGNSGGPLLNMQGEVIGITSAKTVTASYDEYGNAISAEGLGFAIPINDAMVIVEQFLTKGGIERPGIGISVSTVDEMQAEYYDLHVGALIVEMVKGGKGEEAGLKVGDIVTACDGETIEDQDAFVEYVQQLQVGDEFEVTVWRDGKILEITVTVGDLNKMSSETVEETFDFFAE